MAPGRALARRGTDWPHVVAPTIATVLDDEAEIRYWRARAADADRVARDTQSAAHEAIHRLNTLRERLNTELQKAFRGSPFGHPNLVPAALVMAWRGARRAEWPVHLCQSLEDLDLDRAGLVELHIAAGGEERIWLTDRGRDRLWRASRASELAANGLLDSLTTPLPGSDRRATSTNR